MSAQTPPTESPTHESESGKKSSAGASSSPSPSISDRRSTSTKRASSMARTYQTPLRGNTTDEDGGQEEEDDDDDALSWKSAQASHTNLEWEDDDLTPPRTRRRSSATPTTLIHTVTKMKTLSLRSSRVASKEVEAILHATPVSLAEENRQLKEELAAFKQEHKRLIEAERVLKKRQKRLNGQLTILQELNNNKVEAYDKIFANLNTTLQCQICLEPLTLPYALAPCGHVGCFDCLRSWFTRTVDESDAVPTIAPRKTCPHCRTEISIRPVPLFILKNIVQDLSDAAVTTIDPSNPPEPHVNFASDVDPWEGIFSRGCPCCNELHSDDDEETLESTEEDLTDSDDNDAMGSLMDLDTSSGEDEEEEEDEDEADDEDEDEGEDEDNEGLIHITPDPQTTSPEEYVALQMRARNAHSGAWAPPRWSYPLFSIPPMQDHFLAEIPERYRYPGIVRSQDELRSLLERGATHAMISKYFLTYSDELGIVAVVQNNPRTRPRPDGAREIVPPTIEDNEDSRMWINLGWVLYLHPLDFNGNVLMDAIVEEMRHRLDRYQACEGYPGLPLRNGEIVWLRREPVRSISEPSDDQESAEEEFVTGDSWTT